MGYIDVQGNVKTVTTDVNGKKIVIEKCKTEYGNELDELCGNSVICHFESKQEKLYQDDFSKKLYVKVACPNCDYGDLSILNEARYDFSFVKCHWCNSQFIAKAINGQVELYTYSLHTVIPLDGSGKQYKVATEEAESEPSTTQADEASAKQPPEDPQVNESPSEEDTSDCSPTSEEKEETGLSEPDITDQTEQAEPAEVLKAS